DQRPAVVGVAPQVLLVDGLGVLRAPGVEQGGAEVMADRVEPIGGLVVGELVLEGDGLLPAGDRVGGAGGLGGAGLDDGGGELEDLPSAVETCELVFGDGGGEVANGGGLGAGAADVAGGGEGHAAGVVPQRDQSAVFGVGPGGAEDLLPAAAADHHQQRLGQEEVHAGHATHDIAR